MTEQEKNIIQNYAKRSQTPVATIIYWIAEQVISVSDIEEFTKILL